MAAAAVRNSPEFRQARTELRNAPPGAAATIRIPIPDGNAPASAPPPALRPTRSSPRPRPASFAKVVKGPRGLGAKNPLR